MGSKSRDGGAGACGRERELWTPHRVGDLEWGLGVMHTGWEIRYFDWSSFPYVKAQQKKF